MNRPYAFGAAILPGGIEIGLFDRTGALLSCRRLPRRPEGEGALTLTDISEAVTRLAEGCQVSLLEVEGIGLGQWNENRKPRQTERRLSILTGLRVRCASLPRPDLKSSLRLLNE